MGKILIPILILLFPMCKGRRILDGGNGRNVECSSIEFYAKGAKEAFNNIGEFSIVVTGEAPLEITFIAKSKNGISRMEVGDPAFDEIKFSPPTTIAEYKIKWQRAGEYSEVFKFYWQENGKECSETKKVKINVVVSCPIPAYEILSQSIFGEIKIKILNSELPVTQTTAIITTSDGTEKEIPCREDNLQKGICVINVLPSLPSAGDYGICITLKSYCGKTSGMNCFQTIIQYRTDLLTTYGMDILPIADAKDGKFIVSTPPFITILEGLKVKMRINSTSRALKILGDKIYSLDDFGLQRYDNNFSPSLLIPANLIFGTIGFDVNYISPLTLAVFGLRREIGGEVKDYVEVWDITTNSSARICFSDLFGVPDDAIINLKFVSDYIISAHTSKIRIMKYTKTGELCDISVEAQYPIYFIPQLFDSIEVGGKIIFMWANLAERGKIHIVSYDKTTKSFSETLIDTIQGENVDIKSGTIYFSSTTKIAIGYSSQIGMRVKIIDIENLSNPPCSVWGVELPENPRRIFYSGGIYVLGEKTVFEISLPSCSLSSRKIFSTPSQNPQNSILEINCETGKAEMYIPIEDAGIEKIDISPSFQNQGTQPKFISNYDIKSYIVGKSGNSIYAITPTGFTDLSFSFFVPFSQRVKTFTIGNVLNKNLFVVGGDSGLYHLLEGGNNFLLSYGNPVRYSRYINGYFFILSEGKIILKKSDVTAESSLPTQFTIDAGDCRAFDLEKSTDLNLYCLSPTSIATFKIQVDNKQYRKDEKVFSFNIGNIRDVSLSGRFLFFITSLSSSFDTFGAVDTQTSKIVVFRDLGEGEYGYTILASHSCVPQSIFVGIVGNMKNQIFKGYIMYY